jgi:hypothetical protein
MPNRKPRHTTHAEPNPQQKPAQRRRSRNPPNSKDGIRAGNRFPSCRTIDSPDSLPPVREAPQDLVRYFDDHHGFWRIGRLISSRTVKRGQHKGRVILTIESMLHQRLTLDSEEVERVQ